jgi:hypothetical protein
MAQKLPPHVRKVTVKGKSYFYYQRHRGTQAAGKQVRLPNDPDSPEFWAAYADLEQLPRPKPPTNTFNQLLAAWQSSPEWADMSPRTQREWSRHCRHIKDRWGPLEVRGLEPKHILAFRDTYVDRRAEGNNMLRCLSSMLRWSVPRAWRADNPCRDVPKFKPGERYKPWPWEAICVARETLPDVLWWMAAMALYTGQRLSDVIAMRWDAVDRGLIRVVQEKTGIELWIPLHRDLKPILDAIPRRAVTILTSSDGTPWTDNKFQKAWADHKPQALAERGFVYHGLRKSAVCMLLEASCTDAEVSAVTGQSRKMVEHYSRMINRKKLAAKAILKWEQDQNTDCQTDCQTRQSEEPETGAKSLKSKWSG